MMVAVNQAWEYHQVGGVKSLVMGDGLVNDQFLNLVVFDDQPIGRAQFISGPDCQRVFDPGFQASFSLTLKPQPLRII